jgi:hypothetical protein
MAKYTSLISFSMSSDSKEGVIHMFGCTALLLYIVRLVSQAIDKKCFQHKMCVKVHK